jgi:hypothetical protein
MTRSGGYGVERIEAWLCVPVETLCKWVWQAKRDQRLHGGLASTEQDRVKALERES